MNHWDVMAKLTRRITNAYGLRHVVVPLMRRVTTPLRMALARRSDARIADWVTIPDYRGRYFLKIDRSAYMGSSIYWLGWHHRWEIEYLEKNLRHDDVFIDIGANFGEFTVAVAGRLSQGRVIASEPHEPTHYMLAESVNLNKFSNVILLPYGLGATDGKATLFDRPSYREAGLRNEGLFTQFSDASRDVIAGSMIVRRLDTLVDELRLNRLDWIKIDVEGAEFAVLQGACSTLETYRPKLLVELNRQTFTVAGYSPGKLLDWLQAKGYQPYRFASFGRIVPLRRAETLGGTFNALMMP